MSKQPNLISLEETDIPESQKDLGQSGVDLFGDKAATEETSASYLVLARKYRPINFEQLIGQEVMVKTLANAFESNRLPHAIMLSGMRGVGKTTTARIIARAVNYTGEGDLMKMADITDMCRNILESRHPDVLEMDAASRTGIEDIRDIIDSTAYRPVMARKKVYIIDEVHMLSKAAFNGLLKTLEEPPAHVMFIFATTEIHKVPITILSRCQRFDLRRLTMEETLRLMRLVLAQEKIEAEDTALLLLARAAEGSARDCLSLLDQAIAHHHGDGGDDANITEEKITQMLGLTGGAALLDLFDSMIGGNPQATLAHLQERFDYGADPLRILRECADLTHFLTRQKVSHQGDDYPMAKTDRERAQAMAEKLTLESLSRLWQMLLKGLEEVRFAPDPYRATEMVIIRLAHAQTLPSFQTLAATQEKSTQPQQTGAEQTPEQTKEKPSSAVNEVLSHFPGAKVVAPNKN